jgi:hypothetical protein
VQKHLKKIYQKLPFALKRADAEKAIADREANLLASLNKAPAEPGAIKRKLK